VTYTWRVGASYENGAMTEGYAMVPAASAQPVAPGRAKGGPGEDPGGDDAAGSRGAADGVTCPQLRIKGLRIHAEIYGEGDPLLMHSGLWAEAALWRPMLPYLPGYQVIAFDPPGVGHSDMPSLPLTMSGLAEVGTAVLDELGIGSAHVLGASFGGAVAQQMAVRHPDRVRSLVLVSTSFGALGWPGDPLAYLLFMLPNSFSQQRLPQVAGRMFGGRMRTEPGLVSSLPIRRPSSLQAVIYRMAPLLFGWTSLPWLGTIPQPTLIICGDDDPITPQRNHALMVAMMRQARLHTVPGGGHLAMVDSPELVAPVIAEFLGGQAAPAPIEPGRASGRFRRAA
jgi:poly(3-hydroxyoctanoate) depolymerase